MSRHPNRPCSTSVSWYESHFHKGRQYQWICEGCGAIKSGFLTEAAAEMAGLSHAGLAAVASLTAEEAEAD